VPIRNGLLARRRVQDAGYGDAQGGREYSGPASVAESGRLEAHGDDDGTRDGRRRTRPSSQVYVVCSNGSIHHPSLHSGSLDESKKDEASW